MKVATIFGTRPEIIKLSAFLSLVEKDTEIESITIHTGQHYDHNMDAVFFEELHLAKPTYELKTGIEAQGLQGKQTALMLEQIENILLQEKPDVVVVQGDTNSTLSGALAAVKLQIPIVHVEAGCRSFNREMPEEINRVITDIVSTVLIAPDEVSVNNLIQEGIAKEKIQQLGSTTFEAVLRNLQFADKSVLEKLELSGELKGKEYILVTIHRAENTNDKTKLTEIIQALDEIAEKVDVVFPMHPRTKKKLAEFGIMLSEKIAVIEPQGYLSFLALLQDCMIVISDSGGIQEEALALDKSCIIPREETEWTYITDAGKNLLVGTTQKNIVQQVIEIVENKEKLQALKEIRIPFPQEVSSKIINVIKELQSKES